MFNLLLIYVTVAVPVCLYSIEKMLILFLDLLVSKGKGSKMLRTLIVVTLMILVT